MSHHSKIKLLLEKYFLGCCSEEESRIVEDWLENSNEIEYLDLPEKVKETQKQLMWEQIIVNLPKEKPASARMANRVNSSVASALFSLIFVTVLLYFGNKKNSINLHEWFFPTSSSIAAKKTFEESQDVLYISTPNTEIEAINRETCRVVFDGMIRLFYAGNSVYRIVCNGAIFNLIPNKVYYLLDSSKEDILVLTELPHDESFFLKPIESSYKICG